MAQTATYSHFTNNIVFGWKNQYLAEQQAMSRRQGAMPSLSYQGDDTSPPRRRGRPRKNVDNTPSTKTDEPAQKFQIVMSTHPGHGSDPDNLRLIRSHAMLAVRKKQRDGRKSKLDRLHPLQPRASPSQLVALEQHLTYMENPTPQVALISWAGDAQEVRAMAYFREKAVFQLCGWNDATFWSEVIPRRSQYEPELRHAIVALSSMHETLQNQENQVTTRLSKDDESMFAITQYNKALASLRNGITQAAHATVLISSILISSFQAFDNDPHCFLTWKSGLALLDQYLDENNTWSAPGASEEERNFITGQVAPMLEMYRNRCCNFFDQTNGLKISLNNGKYMPCEKPEIPFLFKSLWHAHDMLNRVFNWVCGTVVLPVQFPALHPTMEIELDQLLEAWSRALEATSSRKVHLPIARELSEDEFLRTKGRLEAARLVGEIIMHTVGTSCETEFDRYDRLFDKIVRIYQQTEPSEMSDKQYFSFGIQSGVLETLIFVSLKCRDPVIRRQAMAVLRLAGRFEGPFNGVQNVPVLEGIANIEEEGLGPVACSGDVPESQRIRFESIEIFPMIEKIRLRYNRYPYEFDFGATIEQRVLTMPPRCGLKVRRYVIEEIDLDSGIVPAAYMGRGYASFPLMNSTQYYWMQTKGFDFPIPRV